MSNLRTQPFIITTAALLETNWSQILTKDSRPLLNYFIIQKKIISFYFQYCFIAVYLGF